ncbi:putative phage abortive infection protein [Chryseobacterium sp.]|uniref:putative phage abortive infection protein n=1 Tax=Chryseobacterium sp. TaxID=1871047 RepID=UPI00289D9D73|nr:putative phage abortive infection protein [Chryseobacterium sp.]
MQRQELQLQRNELEETRDEFVTQNYTLKLQQFENTFFQMLKMYQNILNNLNIFDLRNTVTGKRVFIKKMQVFNNAANEYVRDKICIQYLMKEDNIERFNIGLLNLSAKELLELYKGSSYNLKYLARAYFAIIYSMLSLIDKSNIKESNVYVSILKTQLSDEELW